jgi:uncharacterized protein YndB with AHSA1/START domain
MSAGKTEASMKRAAKQIVVWQTFDAPVGKARQAITERDRMARWYFAEVATCEPVVGFETRFTVKNGGRELPDAWKVAEVSEGKRISCSSARA